MPYYHDTLHGWHMDIFVHNPRVFEWLSFLLCDLLKLCQPISSPRLLSHSIGQHSECKHCILSLLQMVFTPFSFRLEMDRWWKLSDMNRSPVQRERVLRNAHKKYGTCTFHRDGTTYMYVHVACDGTPTEHVEGKGEWTWWMSGRWYMHIPIFQKGRYSLLPSVLAWC